MAQTKSVTCFSPQALAWGFTILGFWAVESYRHFSPSGLWLSISLMFALTFAAAFVAACAYALNVSSHQPGDEHWERRTWVTARVANGLALGMFIPAAVLFVYAKGWF